MQKLLWLGLLVFGLAVCPGVQAEGPVALEPLISQETRLLIFAPHPDDESLGAAGLIQRVLTKGGRVKVVFMTNGDGFPGGVEKEVHISHPTAADYRKYGKERRMEAVKAIARLGLKKSEAIFLGFPDGGLSCLRRQFLAGPAAYRSPFTLADCPPASAVIIPHTGYTGHDLTREIECVISDFRPNLVATTPPQDEHPDHSATYCFVKQALAHLGRKNPYLNPRVLTFLIHFGQWPIGQGAGTGLRLDPPEGFPDKGINWASLGLTPEEAVAKRRAILEYQTQMIVMGRYLLSFAGSNELFILEN
ncbi:MAG: PIG-L deacetylase family protein [Desulfobaccales bacterium]